MTTVECGNCGRPSPDGYTLCTTCAHTLADNLATIPSLIADLTLTQARLDRMGRTRVGGKDAETQLPIRLDKNGMPTDASLLDALDTTLHTHARTLCDHHNIRPNRRYIIELTDQLRADRRPDHAALSLTPATTAEIAAVWLSNHPQWLRTLHNPDQAADYLHALIDKARRAIDRMEPLVYRGLCPTCGANLSAEQDATHVECGGCQTRYNSLEVRDNLIDQVHDWNLPKSGVLDLVEQIVVVRIPDATFRSWVNRKSIAARQWRWEGHDHDYWIHRNSTPLYRVGDAVTLATKWEPAQPGKATA